MKKLFYLILILLIYTQGYCQTEEEYYKRGIKKTDFQDYGGAIIDFTKAIEQEQKQASKTLRVQLMIIIKLLS
jgi:hypothetical protein